jgi:hypothetical protein
MLDVQVVQTGDESKPLDCYDTVLLSLPVPAIWYESYRVLLEESFTVDVPAIFAGEM